MMLSDFARIALGYALPPAPPRPLTRRQKKRRARFAKSARRELVRFAGHAHRISMTEAHQAYVRVHVLDWPLRSVVKVPRSLQKLLDRKTIGGPWTIAAHSVRRSVAAAYHYASAITEPIAEPITEGQPHA